MQRQFDIENEKDMADLWDILPDFVNKIERNVPADYYLVHYKNNPNVDILRFIKINWHNKTEITRPIKEATEADIGKLCRFSLSEKARCSISLIEEHDMFGILTKINNNGANTLYLKDRDIWFNHCRRLTKQEIEELI
jgi:uncharacterized sporulation protein YeaH/YhbH (DUF444 family)